MLGIDQIANNNRLIRINPLVKTIFAFNNLILIFIAEWEWQLLIMLLMTALTLLIARVSLKSYFSLFMIPLAFISLSIFSIIISISNIPRDFLWGVTFNSYYIGISHIGLEQAFHLIIRSLSAIATLYFLILTTPFIDLLYVMEKLRFPRILIELLILIYRFIFIFLQMAKRILLAQTSRLGHNTLKNSLKSYGMLFSQIFAKSILRYKQITIGLESRGYEGELW